MKCLVTGYSGQLGYDIVKELNTRGYTDILTPDSNVMDITNKESVEKVILDYQPDVVFHCAAYTAVDKAEEEKEKCYNINVNGTKNIVDAVSKINAKLFYISTDYVFHGDKEGKYEVTDKTNPVNYYGYTKLLGEEAVNTYPKHFIVRISWVFGINGKNFLKTMLTLAETRNELGVVCDQVGSPTYTKDLSKLLVDMSLTEKYGLYHATNNGYCSWNELAKYIFKINNLDIKVNEVLTKDYKTTAVRPLNSKMSKEQLVKNGFDLLPDWQDAVDRYNIELKNVKKLVKEK